MIFPRRRALARWARGAAALTSLALVGALQVPAQAVPTPTGEYLSYTVTPDRPVAGDECRNAANRQYSANLQGLGNEIQSQGYRLHSSDAPVYTKARLYRSTTITGPGNFYNEGRSDTGFPSSTLSAELELCPDDFDGGEVLAGTYTVTTVVRVGFGVWDLCHAVDGCHEYGSVYERTFTYTVEVAAEINAACAPAQAKVASLKAKIKKVKAKKKMKAAKRRAKIRTLKANLSVAKSTVSANC